MKNEKLVACEVRHFLIKQREKNRGLYTASLYTVCDTLCISVSRERKKKYLRSFFVIIRFISEKKKNVATVKKPNLRP